MKRRLRFSFAAVFFLALLLISSNRKWMERVSDFRFSREWLAPDQYKNGDLYGMCFLPQYKEPASDPVFKKYECEHSGLNLYLLHDSYLQNRLYTSYFKGADSLVQIDYRNGTAGICLNGRKKNILLIETAERYARWRLQNASYFTQMFQYGPLNSDANQVLASMLESEVSFRDMLTNPNINSNLEFNLFDYSLFSPIRGLKTALNQSLFGRLPDAIAVSSDKHFLLLKETLDTIQNTGIYAPLSEAETDTLAAHMALIRRYYIEKGFQDVWFSIIPNTATLNDSLHDAHHQYNGLIYRIKAKADEVSVPCIDVYPDFKKNPAAMYKHGDSHWSREGKQLWIDRVGEKLERALR
ncbi:MAG TPA: hypothetical protein VGO45_03565 [Bacteroidia bacterium]|jgi:hypothetical protein|nr:hypothetical protein [Bacteroidia bacterium]